MGKKKEDQGIWHRVCLNTIVRRKVNLDSERLRILPMGSKVMVVEQQDRRVRISQPILGWCSLRSSNGDTILTPLEDAENATTTPLAGEIRQGINKGQKEVSKLRAERDDAKEQMINLVNSVKDNTEFLKITKQLQELRVKVEGAPEEKEALAKSKGQLSKANSELETVQQRAEKQEQEYRNLCEKLKKMGDSGKQYVDLEAQYSNISEATQKAEAKVEEFALIEQAARQEVQQLQKEMEKMFFKTDDEIKTTKKYKPGDVVILKEGRGVAVVKFFGRVPEMDAGKEYIGVELSDANGEHDGSIKGKRYYTVKPNYGKFYDTTLIKKKILAEELLKKLHMAVTMSTREKNAKE